jgi:hypothetical protein
MDDGDGALAIEMLAGEPANVILQTIYNGSASCSACGALMTPVVAMYGKTKCARCESQSSATRARDMLGGSNGR